MAAEHRPGERGSAYDGTRASACKGSLPGSATITPVRMRPSIMRESSADVKRHTRRARVKLQGQVALVTGASRGIGRAIAVGLAAEGAHVALNYVSRPAAAVAVQEAIRALGREGLPVQADVAVAADVERMVAQVLDRFGRIDVLVNNATLHRGRRVYRLPEREWDAVLDSCLKGASHCCQ